VDIAGKKVCKAPVVVNQQYSAHSEIL
jgi:hypothetical protein